MSIEQLVREKHAFRERLKEFLALAGAMTNDELEIALGRLADMLTMSQDGHEKEDARTKGAALKYYFDLRIAGEKSQASLKRTFMRNKMIEWRTKHGQQTGMQAYRQAQEKWKAEYEAFKKQIQGLPFIKRIFAASPISPSALVFIEQAKAKLGMPDYLIAQVTSFKLIPNNEAAQDISRDDIKMIAP